ncbi:YpiF family protein [Metabacillus herbersteinensis]|uniref:YpiF family protein n=1 Tax=Metabacillus herbersteinensis TaxID=283816 RepID=A0ABV6GFC5_9BACI
MKWTTSDVDLYTQSKEYVDTAVVPLVPIVVDSSLKQVVSKGEFVTLLANELERQLKGRIYLLPSLSYLAKSEALFSELQEWKQELLTQFKHVLFITSDEKLRELDGDLKGNIIWLPTVPLEHMDDHLKKKLLQDHVEQILNILLQSWNKS